MQEEKQTEAQEAEQAARAEQIEAFRSLWADKEHVALFDEYNYVLLTAAEIGPAFATFSGLIWGGEQDCDVDLALSETELAASSRLSERFDSLFHLYLGIFERDRLIGWSWGRQENGEEYHMVNTALFPKHQGHGIYTALLPEILKMIQAEGFQLVHSWHQSNNPGVLVPKLKAGFVISGFRVWDRFGLLVQLTYPFNETRRDLFSYRIGRARLSARTAALLR